MLTLVTTFLLSLPGVIARSGTSAAVACWWRVRALQYACDALFLTSLAHHGTRPQQITWIELVDQAQCRITIATASALCAFYYHAPLCAETAPYWLSLLAVWSVSGPVSKNPRYYERGMHRAHAAMHCTAAAGCCSLMNVFLHDEQC